MGRVLSLLLVVLATSVNVFALAGLLADLGVAQADWREPLLGLGQLYGGMANQAGDAALQLATDRFGVEPPEWAAHVAVLLVASVFALGAIRIGGVRGLVLTFVIIVLTNAGAYGAARYVNVNLLTDKETPAPFTNYQVEQAQLGMPIVLLRDPRKEGRRVAILTEDWLYCYPPKSTVYRVPRGYLTDFASIPEAARRMGFSPFGDHVEAAVIHDWLYAVGEDGARPFADAVFRYAMEEQGVSRATREIMHRAVRIGGNAAYGADREWTFYDPMTFEPVPAPFDRPNVAAVDKVSCESFDAQYFELLNKHRTQMEAAAEKIQLATQADDAPPLVLAQAQQAPQPLYGPDQFGNINLKFRQSSSATGRQLEAILGDRAKFEPLVTYSANSLLRRLSAAIGRLDVRHTRATETCTASVISSQYILTNYHCVPGTGEYGPASAAELVMGYYDVANTSTVRRYSVNVTPVEASEALDYAILSVAGNPANDFGVISILDEDPAAGASLTVIHHPLGRPKHVTRAGCQVASNYTASDDDVFHSCDTLPGSSGAPVFAEFGRGVLGLHYAGPGSLGPGQYNFAKRMRRIVADSAILRGLAGAGAGSASTGGPAARPLEGPADKREAAESSVTSRRVGETFSDCEGCPQMVVVPAGSFMMGSPESEEEREADEGPQHPVTISKPFAVGKYEVSFAEWDACVAEGGCDGHSPKDQGWGRGDRPVISVSWNDAQNFVRWLSRKTGKRYQLLSEAEWEYVARAGTTTRYAFGETVSSRQANFAGTNNKTLPVGSYTPNAFGLYDVHGNVWEWTQDCWQGSYSGAPSDGNPWETGGCSRRVLRGGSWGNDPQNLRSAVRQRGVPSIRNIGVGFRVARALEP